MMINWKTISKLGNNKFVKSAHIYLFIVPILAKLLVKINSPIIFQIGGKTHQLILELPFSWLIFFFSALFFTLGSIAYNLQAPAIVQENRSFGDFIEHKKGMLHLFEYSKDIGLDATKVVKAFGDPPKEENKGLHDAFWFVYNTAMVTKKSFIRFAILSYSIGLFLILMVILQGFFAVLKLTDVEKFNEMFCSLC